MTYQQGGSRYLETQVVSSSPEQLIPLLYQHLLVNLKKADEQIRANDIEGKAESLQKASAIVFELLSSLDMEKGGEIAARLASLYSYFTRRISEVGRTLDVTIIQELVELVGSLHESWLEVASRQEEGQP
ncbi:MAG: flagellar export chaperone FliS [Gemmatimonadetes bacterium]|nr:flagellar export chaperone FliS [Gemmatimonadota bacterium]